jgi:bifunctional non-homologous end joining protein LigD
MLQAEHVLARSHSPRSSTRISANGLTRRQSCPRGYNWSHRFPLIVHAVTRLKARSAIIDGEAVVCGKNGVSDFDKLHCQHYDDQVVLFAFDLLELDGDHWRSRPLEERKARLAKLLSKAGGGVYLSEHLAGEGGVIFEHACRMGLEGIVSKRRDFPYRSGRSKCWIKVKNPASPAAVRIQDGKF